MAESHKASFMEATLFGIKKRIIDTELSKEVLFNLKYIENISWREDWFKLIISTEFVRSTYLSLVWLDIQPKCDAPSPNCTTADFCLMATEWWKAGGADDADISPLAMIFACAISRRAWRPHAGGGALLAIGTPQGLRR